jgi:hypothetical protein
MAEPYRGVDHQMRAEFGGERDRGPDAQPTSLIDADRLVTTGLARLAVGSQKQPCRVPAVPPLLFGHAGGLEVGAVAPQPFPAHRDRRAARRQRVLGISEPPAQHGQAPGLGEPLGRAAIAPPPPAPPHVGWVGELTGPQCAPLLNNLDRRPQIGRMRGHAPHAQLVLVFHGAGDRPRPPRRRHRRQRLLALRTPSRVRFPVQPPQPDPPRQLGPIHRAQQISDHGQRLGFPASRMYPGSDPHPRRRCGHHRIADPTQRPLTTHASHAGSHHRHPDRPPHRHRSLPCGITHLRSLSSKQLSTPPNARLPC